MKVILRGGYEFEYGSEVFIFSRDGTFQRIMRGLDDNIIYSGSGTYSTTGNNRLTIIIDGETFTYSYTFADETLTIHDPEGDDLVLTRMQI